jgi:hypothetical protein
VGHASGKQQISRSADVNEGGRHPGTEASREEGLQGGRHPGKEASREGGIQGGRHPGREASREGGSGHLHKLHTACK